VQYHDVPLAAVRLKDLADFAVCLHLRGSLHRAVQPSAALQRRS